MQRRKFLQNGALLGASAIALGSPAAMGKTFRREYNLPAKGDVFHLNYAPHDGMFKNLAGKDILDQIRFMHDQGFRALEDNGMMKREPALQEKIGNLLDKLGMKMGVFVLDKGGNGANTFAAGKQEYTDIFLKGCRGAVETAKRVNATWTTVVPGDFDRSLPLDRQTANVIETLRRGAEILEPHRLVMVLEPLSDTPDLFLRYSDQTYMICKAVNSPSCKILFDIYHMQRNEGDLINHIDRCWEEIAYIQIGDNPGRKEPGTGEIHYKNIFKHLYDKQYKGVLGMEHGISGPGKEGELALIEAYRQADNFRV
jgi:hydroxypyruvate isomerase